MYTFQCLISTETGSTHFLLAPRNRKFSSLLPSVCPPPLLPLCSDFSSLHSSSLLSLITHFLFRCSFNLSVLFRFFSLCFCFTSFFLSLLSLSFILYFYSLLISSLLFFLSFLLSSVLFSFFPSFLLSVLRCFLLSSSLSLTLSL